MKRIKVIAWIVFILAGLAVPSRVAALGTYSVLSYGARPDGIMRTDGAMTAGSAILVSPTSLFSASDVGKYMQVVGAGPGGVSHTDGSMAVGSAVLTSALATFSASDVGRYVVVTGAGSGGANLVGSIQGYTSATSVTLSQSAQSSVSSAIYFYGAMTLEATIQSVQSATSVTLTTAASATINSAVFSYGTDNHSAFQTALDTAGAAGGGQVNVPTPVNCPAGAVCGYVIKASDQTTATAPGAVKIRYSNLQLIGDASQTSLFCRGAYSTYANSVAFPGTLGNIRGFCLSIGDNGGPNGASGESVSNVTISNLHLYGMTNGNTFRGNFAYPPTTSDGWDITHKAIYMWAGGVFSNITVDSVAIQDFKGENIFSGGSAVTGMLIQNSSMTNFNGDGISMLAADLQVLNNTISNGSNAGIENSSASTGATMLVRQVYQGNHFSLFPSEAIAIVGVDSGVATGSVTVNGNSFDTIGQINPAGARSALKIGSQTNAVPPANVTVSSNTCHDCYSFGVFQTSGNSVVEGNTFTVDQYRANSVFSFNYPLSNLTVENNTGSFTASALANPLGLLGDVYVMVPSGVTGGGYAWKNVTLKGNSWNFTGGRHYQFVTSSGPGWSQLTGDNLNWQGDVCSGCIHADADHGLINLAQTTLIEPYGPVVYLTGNTSAVTATVDASKEEDSAQLQLVNSGSAAVTFVPDNNMSLPAAYTLAGGNSASLTLVYRAALGKYVLGNSAASITASAGTAQNATVNTAFGTALQVTVKDSNGYPVAGVSVTFSAPAGGTSASFNGSPTATTFTNASGIATSPGLTANGQAGAYTITATVAGVATPTSFNLSNRALVAASSGSLSGLGTSSVASANLTAEGTADWVHWGEGALERKTGVNPQISNYSVVGAGAIMTYSNDPRALSWTDGTPAVSGQDNVGIYINSLQNGFSFTAPADTTTRMLTVHVGGWLSGGTLTATLSDASAAAFVDSTTPASGQYDRNYTLTYNAASAGQFLTVQWVATSGAGNVTLNGAALATAAGGISATAGSSQSTTVNAAFATALQAIVKDVNNNPVGGVTVTFTAPGSGASASFSGSATASATTNSNGIATAPAITANGQVGSYAVTASAPGIAATASFALSNTAAAAGSITATSGTPQSTAVSMLFATPLQATVKDATNNPIGGVTVTFSAPGAAGPTATFGSGATTTATTNASGIATASALTANGQVGSYVVTASVAGVGNGASFALSNLAGAPTSIAASGGTPQSALVNNVFAVPLQATVRDSNSNPVSGVSVVFSIPAAAAGASFSGSPTATAITNANGVATAPTLTANSQAGFYTILATSNQLATSASFALSNTSIVVTSGISLVQQAAGANVGNNQNTLTVNLNNPPSGSDVLVLIFDHVSAQQTITSISGATWAKLAQNATQNIGDSEIWVGTNPTSANITLTGTNYFGVFQPGYAIVAEFSGVSSTLDGVALLTTGGSWPVTTAGLNTSNAAGALLITSTLSYNGGGSGSTVSSPWTQLSSPGSTYSLAAAFQTTSAPGQHSVTWNGSGSPQVATIILALKAAGSSGSIAATAGTPQSATAGNTFATSLQATVKDANNNPVSGAPVTFTAPSSGASATFGGSATVTATTNASGIATAPALTANGQAGSYTITASAPGLSTPGNFALTNTAGTAASVSAAAGTPQSATINSLFPTSLQAIVKDTNSNPVSGVTVMFSAPALGASGLFGAATTATAISNSSGIASAPSFTANGQVGNYSVTASAAGVSSATGFSLSNITAPPASITTVAGSSQSTKVGTVFGTNMQVIVKDAGNNPVSGASVTFAAPATGASATFAGATTSTVLTNASGIATAVSLTANGQVGTFTVTASVGGVSNSAAFALTNTGGSAVSIATTGGTPQSATVSTTFPSALQAIVKDSFNNAVSGVTVTFSAPASGAGATFGGLSAITATTNTSGIATAPALTANSQAGSYSVTATAAGVSAGASFNLTNTAVVVGGVGALTGAGTSSTATANLTIEGSTDWVHWGDGSLTRKAAVTPQISNYTIVGAGGVPTYNNDPRALSWTDGTPVGSASNNNGIYINSLQNGFSFTVPADSGTRVLTVHVGGWLSGGTLTAHLSDKSAPDYVDSTTPAAGQYDRNYTLTYSASLAGQTLSVSWVATSGGGNVTLNAAALSGGGSTIAALSGTPQSATVNTSFGTPLQATLKDSNNSPLSGITVTYTAPTSGAAATFSGSNTATAVTNASGIATAPALTTNGQAGSYTLTASAPGLSSVATFSLTNLAGAPAAITATAGTPQTATINTAFTTALQATVKDSSNNPLGGVLVTFSAPTSGAGASFNGSNSATATTNASGIATAPALTANGQTGSYSVTASAAGLSASTSFPLSNITAPPASILVTAGSSQTATVNTAFGSALQVTVKDASNNLLTGVVVTFSAPVSGARASFGASSTATATTNAAGIASVAAPTAGSIAGTYVITATAGSVGPASFNLTNTPGNPASIVATSGSPQNATVNTGFAMTLQAAVKDASNNPVSGATVTFVVPATGASASLAGSASVVTDVNGIAISPALTANSQIGTYTVTASVAGVNPSASFTLSNNSVPIVTAGLVQQASTVSSGNQNTMTVTLGKQPAGANVLILFLTQISASQTITSISGATWTRVAQNSTGNIGDSEVWVGTYPTSSTITVTGSNYFGVFQPGYAIIAEFSGIGSTIDGAELNTGSGSWPVTTGSLTTANAGDILLTSAISYNGGGSGASVGGPWTLLAAPAGTYSLSAAYQLVTATGTYTATWNGSGSPQVATIILALKAGGGSGSIIASAGASQSATVNTNFAAPLQATVKDVNGTPLSGVVVTFTAPSSGAAATFNGSLTATATSNLSGIATSPAFTANSKAGSYAVTASAAGTNAPASFSLTNLAGTPAGISATAGTPQTATISGNFATALQATVKDANNNPLNGIIVTFSAPVSGATASFSGSASATATTNALGIATSPALTANSQAGSYSVTAATGGVSATASFTLTNSTAPPIPITRVQQAQIDSMINIPSESISFNSPNTAGNWIGVAIFGGQGNTHTFTVTDSNGNTYKTALTQGNTHDNITLGMYYAENIKGGANQITVMPDHSGYIRIVIVEYSGLATSNSVDATVSAQGTSVSPFSGTVNTASSGDLLWGASASADAEPFAGPGYMLDALVPAAPGTALTTEDQIQTSAGPASASLTFSSAKDWTMGLVAVRKGP